MKQREIEPGSPEEATFRDLTAFASGFAIQSAYELGVWDWYGKSVDGTLSAETFADAHGLNARLLIGLLEYLTRRDYLIQRDDGFALGERGRALVEQYQLGWYVFFVGGYNGPLSSITAQIKGTATYGKDVERDGRWVAVGSRLTGASPRHGNFAIAEGAVRSRGEPEVLVDLGCGDAGFLLRMAQSVNAKTAVGIDISPAACEAARENVAKAAELAGKVSIHCGDARHALESNPKLRGGADAITAMFVVHEFFTHGFDNAVESLRDIARLLKPRTGRLYILDKQTDTLAQVPAPHYLPEFKLVHDFTNQYLVPSPKWYEVLERAGLVVEEHQAQASYSGSVLFVCRSTD